MFLSCGLSLAPRTFTKCMDAALSQLKTDGNPHAELPRQLANFGSVRGQASISQIHTPQPLRVPRKQGQFCQERAIPQPMNLNPGNSYRLSPNEGGSRVGYRNPVPTRHRYLWNRYVPNRIRTQISVPHFGAMPERSVEIFVLCFSKTDVRSIINGTTRAK